MKKPNTTEQGNPATQGQVTRNDLPESSAESPSNKIMVIVRTIDYESDFRGTLVDQVTLQPDDIVKRRIEKLSNALGFSFTFEPSESGVIANIDAAFEDIPTLAVFAYFKFGQSLALP